MEFRRDLLCESLTGNLADCTETGSGPPTPYRPFTYYVDSETGNDTLDGMSSATAWQTLDQVWAQEYLAGTCLAVTWWLW